MNNNIIMDNLEIREDLLLMSSIPLVISDGKIGKIKINVHHEFALQIMIRFQCYSKIIL
jgi:hypothetical protein